MKLYTFASNSIPNIWAAVGASAWAVRTPESDATKKQKITKALKMPIGAFGIFYCSKIGLTTPFVVYSCALEKSFQANIWEGHWFLQFRIKPLGDPSSFLSLSDAKAVLPSISARKQKTFDELFYYWP